MYRLEREEFTKKPYVFLWALLAFQAGFVNAFGFLSCGRYVSHVTGFGTQIGVSMANSKVLFALEISGFPLSFMAGAFLSGALTIARIERKKKPRFDIVIVALPAVFLALVFLGVDGLFGPFGEHLISTRDFILLYSLSFVCGLQNSCFAIMTKGQIRTTHLTGLCTDVGSETARIHLGRLSGQERRVSQQANFSRFMVIAGFTIGSVISVLTCQEITYLGLLVPLCTSLVSVFAVRTISRSLDKRFEQDLVN